MIASTVYIASDHAGLDLKNALMESLKEQGITPLDLGTTTGDSCNYPDFAHALCHKVLEMNLPGILICGTGIGMSIAANRHEGIRAALCTHEFHAKACRQHNDANVLCLGARVTAPGLAVELTNLFLNTPFEGGRHQTRIELIENITND